MVDFEETIQENKRLSRLVELSMTLNSTLDLGILLQLITTTATELLDCEAASILLYNEKQAQLLFAATTGSDPKTLAEIPVPLDRSLAGEIFRSRASIILSDVKDDSRHYPLVSRHAQIRVHTLVGVPMAIRGWAIGVLEAINKRTGNFNDHDEKILSVTASHAAIAIHNSRLFTQIQNSREELRLAYDATIAGWSHALELRDQETEGHTQRVADMTVRLARVFGMGEDDIVNIRRGAILHDIGKIGVPDSILLKSARLTEDEWTQMRRHPRFAYEMLVPIDYLKPALDIPYCHHEKWDGTGYPRGLRGEEIPLAARLFAVVDVWDALTNPRPYRESMTKEQALQYLRKQSGMHFDPCIVEIFMEMVR